MNTSIQQAMNVLFKSISPRERFRNKNLELQAKKIRTLLAQIKCFEREKANENRRQQTYAPLIRGLN